MGTSSNTQRYRRTRRQLPERIRHLRWLREALGDPPGCERRTTVDDATVWVSNCGDGRIELRVDPPDLAQRLADEFFGHRYQTRAEQGDVVFIGRPL
jgi:hypothetical protein